MPITYNSNISSLAGQRRLQEHSFTLSKVFQRLSSGQRINSASDDAAGLAIASQLNANARVYSQALLNANDGISLLSIAEGTLTQATSILDRINELATQAASGTLGRTQRLSLESEASQLTLEYNRALSSIKFNGRSLLDGSVGQLSLQLGFGNDGVLQGNIGQSLNRASGTAQFGAAVTSSVTFGGSAYNPIVVDFNNDGKDDLLLSNGGSNAVYLSNGDGSFSTGQSFASIGGPNAITGDFNGDGIVDLIVAEDDGFFTNERTSLFYGVGNGTFSSGVTLFNSLTTISAAADYTGDGRLDFVVADGSRVNIYQNIGNGSFSLRSSFSSTLTSVYAGDFDGNGKADIFLSGTTSGTLHLNGGTGTFGSAATTLSYGSITSLAIGDINYDGLADIVTGLSGVVNVYKSRGNGTFENATSYAGGSGNNFVFLNDINSDGYVDISSISATDRSVNSFFNQKDGTFTPKQSFQFATAGGLRISAMADLNGDGVKDALYSLGAGGSITSQLNQTSNTTSLIHFNLSTQTDARSALTFISTARERLSKELGSIGALQSRLGFTINTLSESRLQATTAASRITDIDVAESSSQLVRTQILQQVSSAVLSQANLLPQIALNLLGAG